MDERVSISMIELMFEVGKLLDREGEGFAGEEFVQKHPDLVAAYEASSKEFKDSLGL